MTTIQSSPADARFARLSRTTTFRDGGIDRWRTALLIVAGCGMLGGRLVAEAVLSGANVLVCDFDVTTVPNLATQHGEVGRSKVLSLAEQCNRRSIGHVDALAIDIRHLGIGQFKDAALIVDCTDDPRLEMPLTTISNGLRIPKLRIAVDGSGKREFGRVSCSHGGDGFACGICTYNAEDLIRQTPRTQCPGQTDTSNPTIVGGALASTIVGVGLLQAQRLVTGNDAAKVLDREVLVDLDQQQIISLTKLRCEQCLSGHLPWKLTHLDRSAKTTTFGDLLEVAQGELAQTDIELEPHAHPLYTAAYCDCGEQQQAVGARWAPAPCCGKCGQSMRWVVETRRDRVDRTHLSDLDILHTPLAELGLPRRGAMITARAEGRPPLRLVLA